MSYKPFKMKGSPMKRNFGVGRTESPEAESPFNIDLKTGIANATSKLKDFWSTNKTAWRDNVRKLGGATEGMTEDQLKKSGQLGWGKVAMKSLAAGMRTLKGGYDAFQTDKKDDGDDNMTLAMEEMNKLIESLDEEELKALYAENEDMEKIVEGIKKTKTNGKFTIK